MTKWEYKIIKQHREYQSGWTKSNITAWQPDLDSQINAIGLLGWELVSVVPISSQPSAITNGITTELCYYFKKAIHEG